MADPSSPPPPPPPPPPQQPSGERAEGMEASIALAGATFVAKQFVDTIDGGTGKLKGFFWNKRKISNGHRKCN